MDVYFHLSSAPLKGCVKFSLWKTLFIVKGLSGGEELQVKMFLNQSIIIISDIHASLKFMSDSSVLASL